MAAADYAGVVQQLYVSYFGRPADYYGLASFEAQLATLKAPTTFAALNAAAQNGSNPGLTALINTFSNSAESINLYGSGTDTISISKFVNAIYNNVLNRDADVSGLSFWVNAIQTGVLTRANAAAAITDAATTNTTTQGLVDAKTVASKTAVATDFTASLTTTAQINGYSGDAAAAAARALVKTVTATTDPVAFHSNVVSSITNIVTGSQPSTTTALTLNQDSLTGGSGNDTFNAGASIDAQGNLRDTLQGVDIIDGGAGNDTLNITEAEGSTITATIRNVENINVTFGAAGTVNLASASGVSVATVANSTTAGTVSGVGSIATLGVSHQLQDVTFTGNSAKTLGLNLDTFGKSSALNTVTTAAAPTTLNVTANAAYAHIAGANAIATLNVAATGSNKLDFTAAAAAIKTVTVTGSGSVDLTNAGALTLAAATKLDASGNAGGVTVNLSGAAVNVTGGSGDDTISFSTAIASTAKVALGAGDDVLTIGALSAAGAAVAGGDGTDTLVVTDAAFLDSNSKATYTGFEVLEVSNNTGGALAFDPTLVSGITSYVVDASADSVELKNLAAAAAVTVTGDLDTALVLTLKDASGGADAVAVTLDNGATAATVATGTVGVTVAALTAIGVETVTLHSNGTIGATAANGNVVTNDVANVTLSKVIIDGSADISFTTGAAAHNLTIDATAATGAVTIDASAALATTLVNINGGAGADSFKGGIGGGAIYGGAAGDTIDLTAGVGKVDTLVYKAAADSSFAIKADGSLNAALIDSITAFTTGEDKLDLTSLNFTANTDKVAVQKAAVADLAHLATLAATADFYNDASSIARGVVVVGDGTNTFVFVDANHDHKFDASTDLVIKLAGAQALVTSDIIFG